MARHGAVSARLASHQKTERLALSDFNYPAFTLRRLNVWKRNFHTHSTASSECQYRVLPFFLFSPSDKGEIILPNQHVSTMTHRR